MIETDRMSSSIAGSAADVAVNVCLSYGTAYDPAALYNTRRLR